MKLKGYFAGILLLLQALVYGGSIEVGAGPFAYFGVELPRNMVAGETYTVTVTAFDAYGNKTGYFGVMERTFSLKTTGSVVITPATLRSGAFRSGSVALRLSDSRSETAVFGVEEGEKPILVKDLRSGEFVSRFSLKIGHEPLAFFALGLPGERAAGEPFDVNITAKNAAGDTVTGYGNFGKGVTVTVIGRSGEKRFTVPAEQFVNGVATVTVHYDIPESVRVIASERGEDVSGRAGPFTLLPQKLSKIELRMPASIRTGELFPLKLTVFNQFGRVMKNYAAVGKDLMLSSDGKGRLIPDRVPASAFVEGKAAFETLYTKPDAMHISAAPIGTKQQIGFSGDRIVPMPDASVNQTDIDGKEGLPLSLRFASNLGTIERVDSEYHSEGALGVTYISVYFENGNRIQEVQSFQKEILAKGRVIGILAVDGMLDSRGRLVVRITEKEPFTVDARSSGSTLKLRFFL